jgi:hypothetical protein
MRGMSVIVHIHRIRLGARCSRRTRTQRSRRRVSKGAWLACRRDSPPASPASLACRHEDLLMDRSGDLLMDRPGDLLMDRPGDFQVCRRVALWVCRHEGPLIGAAFHMAQADVQGCALETVEHCTWEHRRSLPSGPQSWRRPCSRSTCGLCRRPRSQCA